MNPDAKEAARYHLLVIVGLLMVASAVWMGSGHADGAGGAPPPSTRH